MIIGLQKIPAFLKKNLLSNDIECLKPFFKSWMSSYVFANRNMRLFLPFLCQSFYFLHKTSIKLRLHIALKTVSPITQPWNNAKGMRVPFRFLSNLVIKMLYILYFKRSTVELRFTGFLFSRFVNRGSIG